MQLIKRRAHARAGLLGNPSDGFGGKTISFALQDFFAEVVLYEWQDVEIVETRPDRFGSVRDLVSSVSAHGYYGGKRLIKATIKQFVIFCDRQGLPLHGRNFAVRYTSTIPRQVGLAGSSALITATLRCLMAFYGVSIPLEVQPSLILAVETDELGIPAGLQDRVAQVYEGLVAMDFSASGARRVGGFDAGTYEQLDPATLPPIYLAWRPAASEPTEVPHSDLRGRFRRGDEQVHAAMRELASLVDQARDALTAGHPDRLAALIDRNFDLRRSMVAVAPAHLEMIERARDCGASAKFAGSGGATVGTVPDDATFERVVDSLGKVGCRVIRPTIKQPAG